MALLLFTVTEAFDIHKGLCLQGRAPSTEERHPKVADLVELRRPNGSTMQARVFADDPDRMLSKGVYRAMLLHFLYRATEVPPGTEVWLKE